MSNSVLAHKRQPTRLRHSWDSSGKNAGVGCRFLLQCMTVKSESGVAQSYPTLHDPMDCSLPGSLAHGIFQARVLEWGAIAFSGNSARIYIFTMFYFIYLLNYPSILDFSLTFFVSMCVCVCVCVCDQSLSSV